MMARQIAAQPALCAGAAWPVVPEPGAGGALYGLLMGYRRRAFHRCPRL